MNDVRIVTELSGDLFTYCAARFATIALIAKDKGNSYIQHLAEEAVVEMGQRVIDGTADKVATPGAASIGEDSCTVESSRPRELLTSNPITVALRELIRLKDLKTDANNINTSGNWEATRRRRAMLEEHDAKKGEAWDAARRALHAFDSGSHETGERRNQDERTLRRLLAVAYSGSALYGDDGELQDGRHPMIDYVRDSVADIERKIHERGMAKLAAAACPECRYVVGHKAGCSSEKAAVGK